MATSFPSCIGINNYLYRPLVATTAVCQRTTLATLRASPQAGNTAVGVGCFFTLNAAAVRDSRLRTLIIVDKSLRVEHFWSRAALFIENLADRLTVIERIKELLLLYQKPYFRGSPDGSNDVEIDARSEGMALDDEISNGFSWLSDDVKFQRIRSIFTKRRFLFIRADLCDVRATRAFKSFLSRKKLTIDFLYLANVGEYVALENARSRYLKAMKNIVDSSMLVISAHFSSSIDPPVQYVRKIKPTTSLSDFLFPTRSTIHQPVPISSAVLQALRCAALWMNTYRRPLIRGTSLALCIAAVYWTKRIVTHAFGANRLSTSLPR